MPNGSSKRIRGFQVFGVSIGDETHAVFVRTSDRPAMKIVRSLLADRSITKVWHNYVYDRIACDVSGIRVRGPFEDTLLMARLWDDDKPHGLKPLYALLTGEPNDDEKDMKNDLRRRRGASTRAGNPKGFINYSHVDPSLMARYARGDVRKTRLLYLLLQREIDPVRHLYDLDKRVAGLAIAMTHRGVAVDVTAGRALRRESLRKQRRLERELKELARSRGVQDFAPSKNKTVRALLEADGVPSFVLAKNGRPCVAADVLKNLAANGVPSKAADKIVAFRKISKLNGTYLTPFLSNASFSDSAIHAFWNVGGARTGRFSSSRPNMQNLSRSAKDEDAPLRSLIVPRPGYVNLYVDYSQVELRYLAALTQDPHMLHAYRTGKDLHDLTSRFLSIIRQDAKPVNFGIIYGEGAAQLAFKLGISFAKAAYFIRKWFSSYPAVEQKRDELQKQLHHDGYITDMFGRRYFYPKRAPHKAINAVIQGGCSTLLKMAMVSVDAYVRTIHGAAIIQSIHDELGIEIPANRLSRKIVQNICNRMEDIPEFTKHGVDLVVEPSVVRHDWAHKEPIEDWRGKA